MAMAYKKRKKLYLYKSPRGDIVTSKWKIRPNDKVTYGKNRVKKIIRVLK